VFPELRYESPGIYKIPAELIKAEVEQFVLRYMNLLILFGIKKNCLRSERSQSLYVSIRRAIKQTAVFIEAYHFCQLHTKFYPVFCCQGQLHIQRKLLGIISADFDATGHLLIVYSAFVK
jgi:hypothetical protein